MKNSTNQQKASDWQRLQEHHPEQAQHITEIAKAFGRPAEVIVTNEQGEVILDSNQYKN